MKFFCYFLEKSITEDLLLVIGDLNPKAISPTIAAHPRCKITALNILEDEPRKKAVQEADIVVSMLPARLHIKVAMDLLQC